MARRPAVAVINASTVLTDDAVSAIAAALQRQVDADFQPVWGNGAHFTAVPKGGAPAAGSWWLSILDTPDVAGALGYHDLTNEGLPLGKVFAKLDLDKGYSVSVTASHEALEMLKDPYIGEAYQVGAQEWWAWEVADACEADEYGYEVNGLLVSDFVYPGWFNGLGDEFDHGGHIGKARQLLPGGYIGVWTPRGGWTQKLAHGDAKGAREPEALPGSRRERRARKHVEGLHSSAVAFGA